MRAPQDVTLPEEIASPLARLGGRLRTLAALKGLGIVAVTAALAFVAVGAVDLLWDVEGTTRAGLLVAALAAVLAATLLFIVRPLLLRLGPTELAAVVEHAHPDLRERLTSTIELSDPEVPDVHKGSALMRDLLVRQTAKAVGQIDVTDAVSGTPAFRWCGAAGAMAALLLLPFVFAPQAYSLLWARLLDPWGNYDRVAALSFVVEGGDRVVARGSDVVLRVVPRWRSTPGELPGELRLAWTDVNGERDSRPMDFNKDANAWTTTIPHVFQSFDFQVAADDGNRSREYRIDVVEAPAVVGLTLAVEPPAYTGFPAARHDGAVGTIKVFEGSRLKFDATFNKPVVAARFSSEFLVQPVGDSGKEGAGGAVAMTLAADGRSAALEFVARAPGGHYALELTDEFDLGNAGEPRRVLVITPDEPPTLTVAGGEAAAKARPSDVLRIAATASDDVAVGALELHVTVDGRNPEVTAVEAGRLGVRSVTHEFALDLATLAATHGSIITYRVKAADEYPDPGPHVVWSEVRTVLLDKDAAPPGAEPLAAHQEDLKEALAALRREIAESETSAEELRAQAAEALEKGQPFEKNGDVSELAAREDRAARDAAALAERLAKHPLFENLKNTVQEIARSELAQAAESSREAVDEELRDKAETLRKNAEQLATAGKKLDEAAERFEELAALEKDLLELERLAEQANRLANDVAELDERRENPPPNETDAQRPAREERLDREQKKLEEQQKDLAEQLSQLLKRRPELIEAAREAQRDRLAELAQQAERLAEPQDQVAEALRNEARETSEGKKPDGGSAADGENPRGDPNAPASDGREEAAAAELPVSETPDGEPSAKAENADRAAEAQRAQANVAREAAALALDAAREEGSETPAAERAAEFARNAAKAAEQADAARFDRAAESARQSAAQGEESARALHEANGGEISPLERQAAALAERQREVAESLAEAAASPEQRRQGIQNGQERVARETSRLAEQLADAAEQLAREPLELPEVGDQARQAGDSARQAREAMTRAADEAQRGNPAEAAASAERASANLRKAARQAGDAAGERSQEQPAVPPSAGEQVARAAQELAEAQRADAAGEASPTGAPTPAANGPQPPEGQQSPTPNGRQSGDGEDSPQQKDPRGGQNGKSQSGEGQNGEGANGQGTGQEGEGRSPARDGPKGDASGPGEAGQGEGRGDPRPETLAERLRRAADALAEASRQIHGESGHGPTTGRPGIGQAQARNGARHGEPNRPGEPGEPSDPDGAPSGEAAPGTPGGNTGGGASVAADLRQLESELKRLTGRNWGQLPGHLRTEILQAAKRRPNGEYARLIKTYFEEIARSKPADE